jgi:hypothetical protein
MTFKIFAKINENNIVENVIVCGENETIENISKLFPKNLFIETTEGISKNYIWQPDNNRFISPQPYISWTLNNETGKWEAPVMKPSSSIFKNSENNSVELKPWSLIWNDDLNRWECIALSLNSKLYWDSSNFTWNLIS